MKTTLNVSEVLLKQAMDLTMLATKTETVQFALEAIVRQKTLEKIILAAGSLKFSEDWNNARHGR
ncbi:MAG: type II toxin-antitoxin system VapB family antitoxin [Nitrospirae bacterium]|nr:type II toxin-antitoxin system VapB family antitoxin [Candidatus Troglogloeales bacterium]MBI3598503.1 type II toxin-antitoxin system VapB family antitoxin [Candidatus Troglogloeales bacterium]